MSFLQIPIQTYPNTALGYQALTNAVIAPPFSGQNNTAFGDGALQQNTTGYQNVAIGKATLRDNTTGNNNTSVGMNAAVFNITGSGNTAVGAQALWIGTGSSNTAIGAAALASLTTGIQNTGVGNNAGSAITTGSSNVVLGSYTGNQGSLDIRTLSNYIVLSDGAGNPRLWINDTGAVNIPGGIALTGSLSITGGTVTANNPVLSATQTWNNAAVTFTGWQLNVTDTASNAASLLMDLRVGGLSRFNVSKSGVVTINVPAVNTTALVVNAGGGLTTASFGSVRINESGSSCGVLVTNFGPFNIGTDGTGQTIVQGSTNNPLILFPQNNITEQRNGVNAQTLRVYNTFTDASNYERLSIGWVSNTLTISTQNAGTGLQRPINLVGVTYIQPATNIPLMFYNAYNSSNPVISIYGGSAAGDEFRFNTSTLDFYPVSSGTWSIGRTATPFRNLFLRDYIETSEMTAPAAPAANRVRIYAEDNGSGKTRLMALFATGAAQQIAIEP